MANNLTPKQIVEKLDYYIIGQNDAKRSVAVALRNRFRRMQLNEDMRNEIVPKNILMIGPTGVGKTEIARRLAKLVNAPFIKVEATKFTEVGYVGRDVESMVRDLVEMSLRMVQEEKTEEVQVEAEANKRLVSLLVPKAKKETKISNPLEMLFQNSNDSKEEDEDDENEDDIKLKRNQVKQKLEKGEMEDETVTIELEEQPASMFDM